MYSESGIDPHSNKARRSLFRLLVDVDNTDLQSDPIKHIPRRDDGGPLPKLKRRFLHTSSFNQQWPSSKAFLAKQERLAAEIKDD